jgi:hypothetical protein
MKKDLQAWTFFVCFLWLAKKVGKKLFQNFILLPTKFARCKNQIKDKKQMNFRIVYLL